MAEVDQRAFDILMQATADPEFFLPQEEKDEIRKMKWLKQNADKNFVQRILNPELNIGRETENMTHFMISAGDYVIPMVVDKGEKNLEKFDTEDEAINYAIETGEYIKTDSPAEAEWLAKENYKTKAFKKVYNDKNKENN